MEKILHIPNIVDYQEIENLLSIVNSTPIKTLSISKNIKNIKFGILPILLQLISTIYIKNDKLDVLIKQLNKNNLEKFSKNLIYITSIMRSNLLHDEHNSEYQKEYVNNVKIFLKNMHSNLKVQYTFKGIGTQYICFDWSRDYSYLETLYNGHTLISKEEFVNSFAPLLFKYSISQGASWKEKRKIIENDFASILYELFQNTEDHTRNNSIKRKSIRGFILKYLKINNEEIDNNYKELKDYFNKLQNSNLEFLEMSIFDSGNGLAKSISKKDTFIDFREESQYVLKCFNKHIGSKLSKAYGIGLFEVMEKIKTHKGLFILRTGCIHMKIDYSQIKINKDTISFNNLDILYYENIIGTSFSIVLPLINEEAKNI
jgi:hypothetical protein